MVQKTDTLLKIDVEGLLRTIEERYRINIPRKVVMMDYDEETGSLFIKFMHEDIAEGEPTEDGLVIFHFSRNGDIVAVEITDISLL
ncbi:DUF2283 domain-containing protein [Candidatus Methanodesulfokora washburnensis]|uniref:DUF2283 domain-containing protein n=1 Tax=Candidatus Methanodesulfokora washburnensis TaxID=2478471 RepID=A0A429GJP6_9CREN|nr:DUF2283 domain-containing protein [Candidatus Methanodesulfokores washburnensis]RSN73997.1 DUF2283 domain-containing protein [Candidatus Methanodesulfokores washburnensis]